MEVFICVVDVNSFMWVVDMFVMLCVLVMIIIQNFEVLFGVCLMYWMMCWLLLMLEGVVYYEYCMKIIVEIVEVDVSFQIGNCKLSGVLCVYMLSLFGWCIVLLLLLIFWQCYLDIMFELGLFDCYVDLVEEGIDCMIWVGLFEDLLMVVWCIGMFKCVMCVLFDYFVCYGELNEIVDFVEYYVVNFWLSYGVWVILWVFMIDGKLFEVWMNGSVMVNDLDVYVMCGFEGFGMIQLMLFMVLLNLFDGLFVEVLLDCNLKLKLILIVYLYNWYLLQKVCVFVDWIVEVFELMLVLEGGENWWGKLWVQMLDVQCGVVVVQLWCSVWFEGGQCVILCVLDEVMKKVVVFFEIVVFCIWW